MSTVALHQPAIPITYARLLAELCARWHVAPEELVAGTALARSPAPPSDTRLSPLEFNAIVDQALRLTGEPALGYHFGLHLKLSAHGFLGYAVMTSATLGEAVQLVEKYFTTRSGALRLSFFVEDETAAVQVDSTVDIAPPFAFPFESLLVGLCHAGAYITGLPAMESISDSWVTWPVRDSTSFQAAWPFCTRMAISSPEVKGASTNSPATAALVLESRLAGSVMAWRSHRMRPSISAMA